MLHTKGNMAQADQPVTSASVQERNWVTWLHFSALSIYVGVPIGNIVAPLVLWLLRKDSMPAVNVAGKAVLNFNISVAIYLLVSIPFVFVLIGIPLMIGIVIFHVVVTILAGLAANKGEEYDFPLAIRFIS